MIKDIKKITYDYEGKLFGQGNGVSQPEKIIELRKSFKDNRKLLMKSKAIDMVDVQLVGKK